MEIQITAASNNPTKCTLLFFGIKIVQNSDQDAGINTPFVKEYPT